MILGPVVIVCGGPTREHEVSLASARSVERILKSIGCPYGKITILETGEWQFDPDFELEAAIFLSMEEMRHGSPLQHPLRSYVQFLASHYGVSAKNACVFPLIHGPGGEDGTIQICAKLAGLPYIGSSPLGCALSFHKGVAKEMAHEHGLRVIPSKECYRNIWLDDRDEMVDSVLEFASFRVRSGIGTQDVIVKPATLGSSLGVSRIDMKADDKREKTGEALEKALSLDESCLCEIFLHPKFELECAIFQDDHLTRVSAVGMVQYTGSVLDYETKYTRGAASISPIGDDKMEREVRDQACRVFSALKLEGYARVDGLYCPRVKQWFFNEVNTIPGFGPESHFLRLCEVSNCDVGKMVLGLIKHALHRHANRLR